jgi:LmbE family N-acetylglucosaminyl deacetylase
VNAATRRTLGSVREQELYRACAHLGAQHVECWDYMDGALSNADQNQVRGDVVGAIRRFRPDVVITFDPTGAYGHPDHIAISHATTRACGLSGDPTKFPEQGLEPFTPPVLYHAFFPTRRLLLLDQLVKWLAGHRERFHGSLSFIQGLSLFVAESLVLRYANDFVSTKWFPPGFCIVEQGEIGTSLYVVVSGEVEVVREEADGTLNTVAQLGAGDVFGEMALIEHIPRTAHVIAKSVVTCMIFAPGAPTAFAGRGAGATLTDVEVQHVNEELEDVTTCIDVADYIRQKINAVAAHRTQYPVDPDMFPESMLIELFGREYFVRVYPTSTIDTTL